MTTRPLALLVAFLLALSATGCADDSKQKDDASPKEVLAEAKTKLDEAASWRIKLSTDAEPTSGNAVLAADGVGTHDPQAWKGDVTVLFSGLNATIPVVALGEEVNAKLPLTPSYAVIDPAEYSAPNPAHFMDPETGLSTLLTEIDSLTSKGKTRSGGEVLRTYEGELAGSEVQAIIPSADKASAFPTTVGIDDQGRVSSVSIKGPFLAGSDDVTYSLRFSDYDRDVQITKP